MTHTHTLTQDALAKRQAENLICLRITKQDGLSMQMITEAGIIGKIGLNSRGVGCTLNAIKAKGVVYNRLPCHLALRTVMESSSRRDAIAALSQYGVASACHILIGDATGGTGLECSSVDVVRLEMDGEGRVMHTNHYVLPHDDSVIEAPDWLPDTRFRLRRIAELLDGKGAEGPRDGVVEEILRDEVEGDGASICRSRGESGLATLFSIVMDLGEKSEARVLMGRPAAPTEALVLRP
jgi:isopenicillin-N N-acyltransferase-like protein